METKSYKSGNVEKNWHLVDAEDKLLGRLAVKIATILSGKNKAQYSPNADLGDFVVVVNAEKVKVTGNKFSQKTIIITLAILADSRQNLLKRCKKILLKK